MSFKGYNIVYFVLSMNTLLATFSVHDTSTNPSLKRNLEERSSREIKTKRYAFDVFEAAKYFPEEVFENKLNKGYINDKLSTNGKTREVVDYGFNIKSDKNEKDLIEIQLLENIESLISSNSQAHDSIFVNSRNKEIRLFNSLAEVINKLPQVIPDEVDTMSGYEYDPVQRRFDENEIYSYSNLTFLNKLLHYPSSSFTVNSIRIRFGSGFLNFLSTDQLIRVLVALLSNSVELTKPERSELVEIIFGHIDFSLEMGFNNGQIVSIVTALLMSDVPHCFEQVFLTWKMWKVFTMEEQEKMLKNVINNDSLKDKNKKWYKRDTLVMLYLFVLNRDAANSSICNVFKELVINIYDGIQALYNDAVPDPLKYIKWNLFTADMLDTSLLELPNILKGLDNSTLIEFKDDMMVYLSSKKRFVSSTYSGKKYKIHLSYAFTKFNQTNIHNDNGSDTDVCEKLYFDPKYIRFVFREWCGAPQNNSHSVDKCQVNEFRNAYGAIRQIAQNEKYDSTTFLRLFNTMCLENYSEGLFVLILFSLTKEKILRKVSKTTEWIKYKKNRNRKTHKFIYIEDIFMSNVNPHLQPWEICNSETYLRKITDVLFKLINANKEMHRERYLYQQLLFPAKLKFFNEFMMKLYIMGLDEIGQLDNKEKRMQIARDLIFSKYYHESAVVLKSKLEEDGGNMKEFGISLEKEYDRYGNENNIKTEREDFEKC